MESKRKIHIGIGALKPPINLTMGVFIGQQNWTMAAVMLAIYVSMTAFGDRTFWSVMDDAMKKTRLKIERKFTLPTSR